MRSSRIAANGGEISIQDRIANSPELKMSPFLFDVFHIRKDADHRNCLEPKQENRD